MAESIDVHKVFAEYFQDMETWAYAVSETLAEGSICLNVAAYQVAVNNMVRVNPLLKEDRELDPGDLEVSTFVSKDPENDLKPFVFIDGKLYLQRYYVYQKRIVAKIRELIKNEDDRIQERLNWLNRNNGIIQTIFESKKPVNEAGLDETERIDWQKVAALNAFLHNFSIITGGPGTGKTTTVARILAMLFLQNPELKVALAAPTGKAAARLSESLNEAKINIHGLGEDIRSKFDKIIPRTIHRLLETIPASSLFRHNAENPLEYDLVIIDEASMADVAIMYKLLDAIRPSNRIILIGDKNQLASVEAGSIFGDLCRTQGEKMNHLTRERFDFCNNFLELKMPETLVCDPENSHLLTGHIIQLHRNYRSESQKINELCKLIVERRVEEMTHFISRENNKGVIDFDANYDQAVLNKCANAYLEYIRAESIIEALKKINKIRVLCAVREGPHGIYKINRHLERFIKTSVKDPGLFNPSGTFYHNQLIMVTANNYDLDVFNGDVGIVRRRSLTDSTLVAYFQSTDPDKPKEILPGYLSDYETVFAMTIHKSQGSEFEKVCVILPENEKTRILTRELLYTAVSRAKSNVTIQSYEGVLKETVNREVNRASGINNQF